MTCLYVKGRTHWRHYKKIGDKTQSPKKGKTHGAEKCGKGNPSALEWFRISCSELWMRSKSSGNTYDECAQKVDRSC